MPQRILAIDPGTMKCGLAVVEETVRHPLHHAIVVKDDFAKTINLLIKQYVPNVIVLGGGTASEYYAKTLASLGIDTEVVDEYGTTLAARARYYVANPPRGWQRLLPQGLRIPPVPIDDWAAVVIAERFLLQ